jgi:hypothetical protein
MQIYREVRETSHLFRNRKTFFTVVAFLMRVKNVTVQLNWQLLSRIRKYPEKIEKLPMYLKSKNDSGRAIFNR